MHLICMSIGFGLGYLAHRYEENSEKQVQMMLKKYKHAPRQWAELVKSVQEAGVPRNSSTLGHLAV